MKECSILNITSEHYTTSNSHLYRGEHSISFPRKPREYIFVKTVAHGCPGRGVAVLYFIQELVEGGEVIGLQRFLTSAACDLWVAHTLASLLVTRFSR